MSSRQLKKQKEFTNHFCGSPHFVVTIILQMIEIVNYYAKIPMEEKMHLPLHSNKRRKDYNT